MIDGGIYVCIFFIVGAAAHNKTKSGRNKWLITLIVVLSFGGPCKYEEPAGVVNLAETNDSPIEFLYPRFVRYVVTAVRHWTMTHYLIVSMINRIFFIYLTNCFYGELNIFKVNGLQDLPIKF